ncbi:hypothetical protein HAX54_020550 [Datura stramonium]|uniref:Uncharacterized protein n=1 Tax=Datura stramonium TaxID=4076 RepID=A0ABS8UTR0_DATST|nr:hypothetical protein [Datura stramonium]
MGIILKTIFLVDELWPKSTVWKILALADHDDPYLSEAIFLRSCIKLPAFRGRGRGRGRARVAAPAQGCARAASLEPKIDVEDKSYQYEEMGTA